MTVKSEAMGRKAAGRMQAAAAAARRAAADTARAVSEEVRESLTRVGRSHRVLSIMTSVCRQLKEQDEFAKDFLDGFVGNHDIYRIFGPNCRTFSQSMFQNFSRLWKK